MEGEPVEKSELFTVLHVSPPSRRLRLLPTYSSRGEWPTSAWRISFTPGRNTAQKRGVRTQQTKVQLGNKYNPAVVNLGYSRK
jgi:hypothetical protein